MPISEVHNIDCMEYMATIPDKFFDVIITDPPYGIGLKYNTYNDTLENWFDLMDKFIPEAKRVSKCLIMCSCRINALGYFYEKHKPDWLISWYKGSTGHASFIGFNDWEPLLVFGKNKGVFMHDYFQMQNSENMGSNNHPCPKPVKWFKHLIDKSCKNDFKIFDPFMGSQSSRIAAYDMGFDYYGCELDKDYFETGNKRFEEFKLSQNLFVPEQLNPLVKQKNIFDNE